MKEIVGTANRVLEVNLGTREVKAFRISVQERRLYLGGKGLGLKYLYERLAPGIDPLAEENVLAFFMGVLMGTGAPCSGRFAAVTKSPLTGIMVSSSCGGPFGMAYKTAGYDGLLIGGRSSKPVYLVIDAEGVKFEDAAHLWGKDTVETQEALQLGKKDGALVIGPAGENRVLYANIASGERYFGRGGMGAVMGAKNLKAVVARGGTYRIIPRDAETFGNIQKEAARKINTNLFTAHQYRKYGTAANFKYCNKAGILPVFNFRNGSHERAHEVSGEAMIEKYRARPSTCIPCSILCGHKGIHSDGRIHKIPEYETTALLGPNLGIFDTDCISRWNDRCGRLGIDTISTGVILSYVMEAGEKGILKTNLKFGCPEGIDEMLADIACRRGIGDELANGSRWLSRKYGGEAFAMQVKGMEMPAYDPRGAFGQGLSYAVANRGPCHLSATTFALEVLLGYLNPYTTRAKARFVHFFEALYCVVNSLHLCQFTTYAVIMEAIAARYTPKPLLRLTMQNLPGLALKFLDVRLLGKFFEAITGIELSRKELLKAGHRIHTLERWLNNREGISRKDDTLPARFLQEGRGDDPRGITVPLERMLKQYYRFRGYDDDGIPTKHTLRKFDIGDLAV
jgi:aldehyde:ferredoxin oxidoreductase